MQTFESDRDLEAEITANIQNLQTFYGLNSVNSLQQLAQIIIDPKRSQQLFRQRNVQVSSIFHSKRDPTQINQEHVKLFAQKYTFEKLVQKFPKPKGEINGMLISILQQKLKKQTIVSHQTRKNVWLLASGARFNLLYHKGLYQKLVDYQAYPDYFNRSIQQDINRTVSKVATKQQLQSLQNVLMAFSRRNPYVGYCQGLNFVVNFLITMQFTEEEAFWILSNIIETVIPMDYYTNMIGVVTDQQLFLAILKLMHPQITRKFDQVGLDPSVLSIEWFVCLFTSSLPFYLVKVVWDRLLVEGPRAFIKTGLIIMNHFKQDILKVQEFHEIIMLLERGTKQLTLPEQQFNALFSTIFISREGLALARTLYREYHLKEKLEDRLLGCRRKIEDLPCDLHWPICTIALEQSKRKREEIDIWIFREGHPPRIDPHYLLRSRNNQHKTKINLNNPPRLISSNYEEFMGLRPIREESMAESQADRTRGDSIFVTQVDARNLMIGRMTHICNSKHIKKEQIRENKNRKSVISLEQQQKNLVLKNQNLRKLMQLSEDDCEGQQMSNEELLQRSQTIKFFSKFLNDNMELSNIVIPSTNVI